MNVSNNDVKVRFAPSPTGHLHVGGARTALFNWLFAKYMNGTFVIRIEDTDRKRSTIEAEDEILASLSWLGLDWDETPIRQSERSDVYTESIEKLIAEGKAYNCYCLPDELEERRGKSGSHGKASGYDGYCRSLAADEKERLINEGRKPVVRFKSPDIGVTVFEDLVRGEVSFKNEDLDDLVIMRSDGTATYNLVVAIDDAALGISHVIRGEDHLSNTPKQIQIYLALGKDVPVFAHLPLIQGPDKALLSKRHGATSIEAFKERGFLPEAMINYLALLGWSLDDKTTLISMSELEKAFDITRVTKSAAVFDEEKLVWMNANYIRELTPSELRDRLIYFWKKAGIEDIQDHDDEMLLEITKLCQERMETLDQIGQLTDFFFFDSVEYEDKAVEKACKDEVAISALSQVIEKLEKISDWKTGVIEAELRNASDELDIKARKLFQPIRVAICGKLVSPPLFESLWLLGKAKSLDRLRYFSKRFF